MTLVFNSMKRCALWPSSLAFICLALPVTLPKTAAAQDIGAENRTAARDLASQGVEAYEHKDFATALDRFSRAFSLVPAPSISIMQARSLAQLGRYLEALDRYEKTQRMPLPADAPEAFKQAVADAKVESENLWQEVPRLTIHVRTPGIPPGDLTLLLDSKQVPTALLDVSRPADPGPHEILVRATGYATATRSIVLERRGQATVDIPLLPPGAAPKTPKLASAELTEPGRNDREDTLDAHSSTRTWGWAAVAVGSTGLVLSAVSGAVALGKHSTLETQCHPGCPVTAADDLSTFRTTRTLSYASLFAGSVTLGLGSYWLLSSPGSPKTVGAAVGPAYVGLWGKF